MSIRSRIERLCLIAVFGTVVPLSLFITACGDTTVAIQPTAEREIAPTPTFIVIVFTPTPIPSPTPSPTPNAEGRHPIVFPQKLDPDSISPPQNEDAVVEHWTAFLEGTMAVRGQEPPFHFCADGRLLTSGGQRMEWSLGWNEDMTWEKWWEIALFVKRPDNRNFLAAILNGRDGKVYTSSSREHMELFKSEDC